MKKIIIITAAVLALGGLAACGSPTEAAAPAPAVTTEAPTPTAPTEEVEPAPAPETAPEPVAAALKPQAAPAPKPAPAPAPAPAPKPSPAPAAPAAPKTYSAQQYVTATRPVVFGGGEFQTNSSGYTEVGCSESGGGRLVSAVPFTVTQGSSSGGGYSVRGTGVETFVSVQSNKIGWNTAYWMLSGADPDHQLISMSKSVSVGFNIVCEQP